AANSSLPVVDLGYGLWQATLNGTGNYYNFSNIRYARPPVGELRFSPPKHPLVNRSVVNDGQDGRICPQGFVSWSKERSLFVDAYRTNPNNISSFTHVPAPGINTTAKPPKQQDSRASEDCLFLDVLIPTNVYESAASCENNTSGAPVLVWIFGGGYYEGSTESEGNPAGFVSQSESLPSSSPGVVYVSINYRLGALGWMAGPSFTAGGGTENTGFYDQRFALEWIQDNIHLFGGDPNQVTIMGSSAGASSGLHQITAFGGTKGKAPFQQAFLQSPAFSPNPYNALHEEAYQEVLTIANATSLADLRALSSEEIIAVNEAAIFRADYGKSGFGPVVDGFFVPELPTLLLARGKYAKNVRAVMSGHNTDEGLIFTDPSIQNTSAFNTYLSTTLLPDAQPEIIDYVTNTLYPPVFTNATGLGYNDTISRLSTLLADTLLNCNVQALMSAFGANKSYAYLFEEGPSLHGEQGDYTFYDYGGVTKDTYGAVVNATVAKTFQDWMVTFDATGNPNGPGSVPIQPYGMGHLMGSLSNKGVGTPLKDPAGAERCAFWQKALF
ncbi:alpha/beta-hydrolase, partial [Mollisia scopiformis]